MARIRDRYGYLSLDHNHEDEHVVASSARLAARSNYHDDGEKELGPVVAALSLGSPCTMRFRPKRNKDFEKTETKSSDAHKDLTNFVMRA
ncbi:hypothetical protein B0T21DRAFT_406945 [Apiosordaria backusii]|uniref:Uncharacterized protein n=1 Tax=Apiosordaria backusii TaxID=314023 RepID=A0AA40K752_9PEZI|nr:hypothetical protein B0T21DRAFT_406945 [Apiosordaria backusii]